jgi:hypothetical protein
MKKVFIIKLSNASKIQIVMTAGTPRLSKIPKAVHGYQRQLQRFGQCHGPTNCEQVSRTFWRRNLPESGFRLRRLEIRSSGSAPQGAQLLSSRWAGRRIERKSYRTFQVFIARRLRGQDNESPLRLRCLEFQPESVVLGCLSDEILCLGLWGEINHKRTGSRGRTSECVELLRGHGPSLCKIIQGSNGFYGSQGERSPILLIQQLSSIGAMHDFCVTAMRAPNAWHLQ